jgi:hypothetical protein
MFCPPLQTAPPTGEAAKLASDVAQITSYMVLIYCTYDSHSIRAVFMSLNVYFYKKNKYLEKDMILQPKMGSYLVKI